MKWLTREWATGGLDDDEWDARWSAYQAHNTAVIPLLSNGAERLIEDIYLHDAQIRSFDVLGDVLAMRALIGDLQVGYEFIDLRYDGAELRLEPGASIRSLRLQKRGTEIIYHEVDVEGDGRFLHRVLLWPRGEYEVAFAALTEQREPATPADRR